jgi:tetratricopeptide (TPR) repeat protein
VREELRRIRMMGEVMARRAHAKRCSVLLGTTFVPSPADVIQAIEHVLEVDRGLAVCSGGNKHKAFPIIIILPGSGDGMYDFEHHALLIPIRHSKSLAQSVAAAVIEYRLDSESGGALRQSYLELPKNRGVVSSIQLRELMLKDYLAWVTLEARGYQVFDDATRKWFHEHVAPSLFALKHPRQYGDVSIAKVHEQLDAYEAEKKVDIKDYAIQFHLGILYWRAGHFDKACIAFQHADALRPESKDACYNAALSLFKTDQKRKAIKYWKKYLTLDKASFWVLRVQKFLSTVR